MNARILKACLPFDFSPPTDHKQLMSTVKKSTAKVSRPVREPKTWGARAAEKIRAQCNQLTRAERESLLERARQLAYGTDAHPSQTRRR